MEKGAGPVRGTAAVGSAARDPRRIPGRGATMSGADFDLDAILDSALDELEEEELTAASAGGGRASDLPAAAPTADAERADGAPETEAPEGAAGAAGSARPAAAAAPAADGAAPEEGAAADADLDALRETWRALGASAEGPEALEELMSSLQAAGGDLPDGGDVDRSIARTLEAISAQGGAGGGLPGGGADEMGENIIEQMMSEFHKLGEKDDMEDVVDGMMKQLLGRDIMYEPMKAVCDKFPAWLAEKREQLSAEDYERYGKMYQGFQRIVAVYETEPDNFARLMELMQDIQEYGQPPAEIIQDLAPGLEFSEDGMPNLGGGPGAMPFMPGAGAEGCTPS